MKIGCIGSGYVGSTTMSVLAYKCSGHDVFVTDILKTKIEGWNSLKLPIYEPGLGKLISECKNKNLFFTKDVEFVIKNCDIIFICVNTPTKDYGIGIGRASNLLYLENCCRAIEKYSTSDKVLVEKSTVPLGTCKTIKNSLGGSKHHYTILSNPEFLAEGTAVKDLVKPARVLLGVLGYSKKDVFCRNLMCKVYSYWINKNLILKISSWSSELIKLASNSFLAQKLSSINTMSIICENVGGDINSVSKGVGLDPRIGRFFLKSSAGFGGSCFEKDILNLTQVCTFNNLNIISKYWKSVVDINNYVKYFFIKKVFRKLNFNLTGKKLYLMGLTFKKDTDDVRNSSSVDIINEFLNEKAKLTLYDPRADIPSKHVNFLSSDFINSNSSSVTINHKNPYLNLSSCDSMIILTDWGLFKKLNYKAILQKFNRTKPLFVDSRNYINKKIIKSLGFNL